VPITAGLRRKRSRIWRSGFIRKRRDGAEFDALYVKPGALRLAPARWVRQGRAVERETPHVHHHAARPGLNPPDLLILQAGACRSWPDRAGPGWCDLHRPLYDR
jgi:hypothetical protein